MPLYLLSFLYGPTGKHPIQTYERFDTSSYGYWQRPQAPGSRVCPNGRRLDDLQYARVLIVYAMQAEGCKRTMRNPLLVLLMELTEHMKSGRMQLHNLV